jgi:hypothetical protein
MELVPRAHGILCNSGRGEPLYLRWPLWRANLRGRISSTVFSDGIPSPPLFQDRHHRQRTPTQLVGHGAISRP